MADDHRQFTLRLDHDLFKMIKDRAEVNRRSVNQEISVMLEDQIDRQTGADLELMASSPDPAPAE